jgi:aspartate/methionine/tyrosine aminotransferase
LRWLQGSENIATLVKAPLRPFEYMAWAMSVPNGARYDLTCSGVLDATADSTQLEAWSDSLQVAELTQRSHGAAASEAFAEAIASRYGVAREQISLTIGASLAITQVLIALVRAGDHVIVERPTYEALHRTPEILGARVSRLERKFEDGWAAVPERLAQLLTPRTRAVILSNLHNPSGTAIDASTLLQVADLAARVGAMVLVDEVYLDYAFAADSAVKPACLVARNCISWSSTTKAFGFSALRAGWIVSADPDAAKAIRSASAYLHVQVPVASSVLGKRVLEQASALQARAASVAAAGREVVERWLQTESRVEWVPPAAGLTGALRLPTWLPDAPFADHLRQRYDTQIVPGTMFEAPGYLRLSFGLPPEDLERALANISAALDDLG